MIIRTEGRRHVGRHPQGPGQLHGVEQRFTGPAPQVGRHGVGGVPDERGAAPDVRRQRRIEVVQIQPQHPGLVQPLQYVPYTGVPVPEAGAQHGGLAARLALPFRRHRAGEPVGAPARGGRDAEPQPLAPGLGDGAGVAVDRAAPGRRADVAGAVPRPEQGRACAAVEAVCRDHHVVRAVQCPDVVDRAAEGDRSLAAGRLVQEGQQFGAGDQADDIAGAPLEGGDVEGGDAPAVGAQEGAGGLRPAPVPHLFAEAEGVQGGERAGPQPEGGAGCGKAAGAFEDVDRPAAFAQVEGGGETADAAADDSCRAWCQLHARPRYYVYSESTLQT